MVNERAQFEWIVSRGSLQEAQDKGDPGHMQWLWDIADHSEACLEADGPTAESEVLSARLNEPKFGYLSGKDRLLLRHAIVLRCEAFLTVERRLPRNAVPIERELGIRILTPITHWEMLRPWAALWRQANALRIPRSNQISRFTNRQRFCDAGKGSHEGGAICDHLSQRAALIRRLGRVPDDVSFGPPDAVLVRALVSGQTSVLLALDRQASEPLAG